MVTVVQLVEHQVVILGVAGSSPVSHPRENPRRVKPAGDFALLLGPRAITEPPPLLSEH